jgi:hypothetical protein
LQEHSGGHYENGSKGYRDGENAAGSQVSPPLVQEPSEAEDDEKGPNAVRNGDWIQPRPRFWSVADCMSLGEREELQSLLRTERSIRNCLVKDFGRDVLHSPLVYSLEADPSQSLGMTT